MMWQKGLMEGGKCMRDNRLHAHINMHIFVKLMENKLMKNQ